MNFKRETGSASVTVLFFIAVSLVAASLVLTLVTTASATRTMSVASTLEAAVAARVADLRADVSNQEEICYDAWGACVTVTPQGEGFLLRATSTAPAAQSIERVRVATTGVTHIAGFDSTGAPVWVRVPGFSDYSFQEEE